MGEYFNGHKLGTCDHLMYVTRDELEYFREEYGMQRNQSAGSLPFIKDYLDLNCGWIYRFPQFHDQVPAIFPFRYLYFIRIGGVRIRHIAGGLPQTARPR